MATNQKFLFSFKGKLATVKGSMMPKVIFLPEDIVAALPQGRIRTKGTMNGVPFALAPQYKRDGSRFFSVSSSLRRAAKIRDGEPVDVKFRLVDASLIDMPEELEAVLEQDEKAKKVWDTFTLGLQRGLIHYIASVKNVDSRIKRALDIMEKAKMGKLHAQTSKDKKKEK